MMPVWTRSSQRIRNIPLASVSEATNTINITVDHTNGFDRIRPREALVGVFAAKFRLRYGSYNKHRSA